MCLLTIVGTLSEMLGLFLVALGLTRVQEREFGTPPIGARIRTWVRRVLRRPQHHTVHLGSAAMSAEAALRARGRVRRVPGETLEERVTALEKNFNELESELDERTADFEKDLDEMRTHIGEVRSELTQQEQARERERKQHLRDDLRLQWAGTGFFVVGVGLTGLGSL